MGDSGSQAVKHLPWGRAVSYLSSVAVKKEEVSVDVRDHGPTDGKTAADGIVTSGLAQQGGLAGSWPQSPAPGPHVAPTPVAFSHLPTGPWPLRRPLPCGSHRLVCHWPWVAGAASFPVAWLVVLLTVASWRQPRTPCRQGQFVFSTVLGQSLYSSYLPHVEEQPSHGLGSRGASSSPGCIMGTVLLVICWPQY